jgi:hypothetical protein
MDPLSVYLFTGALFSSAVYRAASTSGLFGLKGTGPAALRGGRVEEELGSPERGNEVTGVDGLPLGSEGLPVMVVQCDGFVQTSSYENNSRNADTKITIHSLTASNSEDEIYYRGASSLLRNDSEYSLGLNRSPSFVDDVNTLGPMCAPGQILCRTGNYAVVAGSVAVFFAYVIWPRIPSVRLK